MRPASPHLSPTRARRRLAVAAIFVAALVAYGVALGGDLLFDDRHSIADNAALRSLWNIPRFFVDPDAFSNLDVRMYRPVLLVTLAIDHALGGGHAWMFKLTNVALHGVCAILVYALARRLRVRFAAAVVAGLVFAVHPLASESINLVSSRSDQLASLGILLALVWHCAAMRGSRRAAAGTALATFIACGGKETGVVVPACLFALEYARSRGRGLGWRAVAARLLPSVAVVVAYLAVRRILLGMATVAVPPLTGGQDVLHGWGRDLVTQACAMSHVLPKFTAQSVAPAGLSLAPYAPMTGQLWSIPVLSGFMFIGLLTWWGLRAKRPGVFVGTSIAWAMALPWVVVPLNQPASEHRFYGSLAAILIVFASLLPVRHLRRRAGRAAVAAVVLVFCALSIRRCIDFHDPVVLWQKCLDQWPHSIQGLSGRASALRNRARRARDGEEFELLMSGACRDAFTVVCTSPNNATARRFLAAFHLERGPQNGEPLTALVMADWLVEHHPKNPFHLLTLSDCLLQVAERNHEDRFRAEAETAALRCLEIAEPKGLVFRQAAKVRRAMGDLEGALAHLDRSMAMGLDHRTVRFDRGEVLIELGRYRDAQIEAHRMLAKDPFDPLALRLLQLARPR